MAELNTEFGLVVGMIPDGLQPKEETEAEEKPKRTRKKTEE